MTGHDAILRAIAYAEHRLCAPVRVADMADAAGYSLYHFCRTFGRLTRHTPYDYLVRRRMTLAAAGVVQTDRRIVDIALDYQFESHEGFTRAFQRMFGVNPADARRQRLVIAARRLPRLTSSHLECLERQGGLIPELHAVSPTESHKLVGHYPRTGEMMCCPVAQNWPAQDATLAERNVPGPGLFGCFRLAGSGEDLSLALDWILHVWLFYAPYALCRPYALILGQQVGSARICVPVARLEASRAP